MERKEKGGKPEESDTDAQKGEAKQKAASTEAGGNLKASSRRPSSKSAQSAPPVESVANKYPAFIAGRDLPNTELERAADYIAERFKEIGVEMIGPAYKHPYALQRTYLGEPNSMSIHKNGVRVDLEIIKDFIPFGVTGSGKIENGKLVFVGYGITAPEFNYDDYRNIDVRGKVVFAIRGEPRMNDPTSIFNGSKRTPFSYMNSKVQNAFKRGAIGFVYINDPVTSTFIRPVGFPWPSLYKRMAVAEMPLQIMLKETPTIPVVHVGEKAAEVLFGGVVRLEALQSKIDATYRSRSYEIPDVTVDLQVTTRPEEIIANNVVGLIRGSGNTDEFVVIGAHYNQDVDQAASDEKHTPAYSGGDNAPGASAILFLAEALIRFKKRPKRNIVLVAFSCEKKGLYGSRAFMDNPPLPMENCVAMINMDIIGRADPEGNAFKSGPASQQLQQPDIQDNSEHLKPFALSYDIEDFFFSSDQPTYVGKKVPVLFYIHGDPKLYQKQQYSKKNPLPKQIEVIRLSSSVVWNIANMDVGL